MFQGKICPLGKSIITNLLSVLPSDNQWLKTCLVKMSLCTLLSQAFHRKGSNRRMKFGYIRVSRDKQTTALQVDTMNREQCEKTFTDKMVLPRPR